MKSMEKEEEKKTLAEFVTGIPDNQIIKIGCVNGSSYVLVCLKSDFPEAVETANNEQKRMLVKNEYNAHNALRHLLNDEFPTMKAFANSLLKRQEDDISEFGFSGYMRFCNDWLRNVYVANSRAEKTTKARLEFRPFEDRLVCETFMADPVIGNKLIIMVEGAGNGKYWDYSEVLEDKRKGKYHEFDPVDGETQEEGE